mmetsp:Transcript_19574/g.34916  ORF Transcript_19574/g.34916 Transcript_19574/m.34916 type:complete len:283 (-) Transcript_19574:520-1368(-)
MPRALLNLLPIALCACQAPVGGVRLDVPAAQSLTVAFVAGTPGGPVSPFAVDRMVRSWASSSAATPRLHERSVAGLPTVRGWCGRDPGTALLTTPTGGAARDPGRPEGVTAIPRFAEFRTSHRWIIVSRRGVALYLGRRVAGNLLFNRTCAKRTLSSSLRLDGSRPEARAEASRTACTPGRPIVPDTVNVHAVRVGAHAQLDLLRVACGSFAKLVGRRAKLAIAKCDALAAARRAWRPLSPILPGAIYARGVVAAAPRVAFANLCKIFRAARQSTGHGRLLD